MKLDYLDPRVMAVGTLVMLGHMTNLKTDQRLSLCLLLSVFMIKFYATKNKVDETEAYNDFVRHLGKLMNDSPDVKIGS